MNNLTEFYKTRFEEYSLETKQLRRKLLTMSLVRLSVFILTCFLIYIFFDNWKLAVIIGVLGLIVFLLLLSKYSDLKRKAQHKEILADINKNETAFLNNNYYEFYDGIEFKDPEHHYSNDIDLFGKGSFFQFINRTSIDGGTSYLAGLLLSNNIKNIEGHQSVIKELSGLTDWRQHFRASARMIIAETDSESILSWINNYKPFITSKIKLLPLVFSILSMVVFVLIYVNLLDLNVLLYWIVLGLGITGIYVKRINNLSNSSDKAKNTIRQYAVLLNLIESLNFESEILIEQQLKLTKDNKKASVLFSEFSTALDALDNRNNMIYAIFGNGFFLTDIKNANKVELWISANKDKITDWFEVIAFFDAYISLGNFAFNHPKYTYPVLVNDSIIKAENLGHPLLNVEKRIDNSIHIKPEEFFIITGANMAGKSTYLRTVSLYVVMANMGLPVCAANSQYSPIKLITSMRTSDSLKDESSYFFSELTRLKFIVDAIKLEPYFIVLDEILKGTNSTDKAIGSKKFVEKLVEGNATGIIATHDLSLCEIENDLTDVKNYYFDAQIIDDELYFDYKFKKGICQNMNASFLLKKMEII